MSTWYRVPLLSTGTGVFHWMRLLTVPPGISPFEQLLSVVFSRNKYRISDLCTLDLLFMGYGLCY